MKLETLVLESLPSLIKSWVLVFEDDTEKKLQLYQGYTVKFPNFVFLSALGKFHKAARMTRDLSFLAS